MPRRPARTTVVAPLLLVMALGLGACGGEDEPDTPAPSPTETSSATESPSDSPSESPTETTPEADIALTFEGGAWTPNGVRVEGTVGEPVTIEITSDTAGELHVHSTPEQEIAYGTGTSTHEVTIESPGVVEIEAHDPDTVVVQLEVR
jgi:hypothetical protein